MQSSPTDLALLAENQLFQAYQVVYYNESTSSSATNSAAADNSTGGGLTARGVDGTNGSGSASKPYAMKSSKVPHKPIEQLIIHNSDNQVKPIIGNKDIEKI